MSALQEYAPGGPVEKTGQLTSSSPLWQLLVMAWGLSILVSFLLGIFFWHLWGPRFHQLKEVMGGLSWTLKSGIRGALVSTWRMLKWGVINFLDTNKSYETEPVLDPHHVEIDRMPPPPAETTVAESGPTGAGQLGLNTSEEEQSASGWRRGGPLGDAEPKWQPVQRDTTKTKEKHGNVKRVERANRMVEASRPGRRE